MKFKKFLTSASLVMLAVVGMFCFVGCGGTPVEKEEVVAFIETTSTTEIVNGYKMKVELDSQYGDINAEVAYVDSEENGMELACTFNVGANGENIKARMFVTGGYTYYEMAGIRTKQEGISTEFEEMDFDPTMYLDTIVEAIETILFTDVEMEGVSFKKTGDFETGNAKVIISQKVEGVTGKIVMAFEEGVLTEMTMTSKGEGMNTKIVVSRTSTVSLPSASELATWGMVA